MTTEELPDLHPEWDEHDGPLEGDTVALSASSLSNAISKPALEEWRAKESAARIHDEWAMLTELRQSSPDDARSWMRDAAFHQHRGKLNARDRGTLIHAHFDAWYGGPKVPDEHTPEYMHPYLANLAKWVEDSGWKPQLQEAVVWRESRDRLLGIAPSLNPTSQDGDVITAVDRDGLITAASTPALAGRLDTAGVMSKPPGPEHAGLGIIDIKTSEADVDGQGRKRRPYPVEVCLQLAAYFYADYVAQHRPRVMSKGRNRLYLFSDLEREAAEPAPTFEWAGVLLVTPERAELYPVNITEAHLEGALACAGVFHHGKSVKGYIGRSIMESNA